MFKSNRRFASKLKCDSSTGFEKGVTLCNSFREDGTRNRDMNSFDGKGSEAFRFITLFSIRKKKREMIGIGKRGFTSTAHQVNIKKRFRNISNNELGCLHVLCSWRSELLSMISTFKMKERWLISLDGTCRSSMVN